MNENLGMGVLLGILGGNEETVNSIKASLGKKAKTYDLEDDKLIIKFEDGTVLTIFDDGQSCCESRYMRTDDDLTMYNDSLFTNIELLDAPSVEDEYGSHDVQFLKIDTDKGSFRMSNHNEHNGYYGGFWIVARLS
jgi:hypothetical protein